MITSETQLILDNVISKTPYLIFTENHVCLSRLLFNNDGTKVNDLLNWATQKWPTDVLFVEKSVTLVLSLTSLQTYLTRVIVLPLLCDLGIYIRLYSKSLLTIFLFITSYFPYLLLSSTQRLNSPPNLLRNHYSAVNSSLTHRNPSVGVPLLTSFTSFIVLHR